MTTRSLRTFVVIGLTLALPSLSFAQATNAPAPAAAPAPVANEAAPAATTAPASAPADSTAPRPATYTLQQGDTLESVGKQWGLTGRQLQRYNHLSNKQVRKLQIGQVIKVPPAK